MLNHSPTLQPKRQQGIALLTIMLIVVIVAALATQMHWDQRIAMQRLEAQLLHDQAKQFALGAEGWAREILNDDYKNSPSTDHLAEDWAQSLPALPIDGGQLQGRIEDLQGRFNLNNLIDTRGNISTAHLEQLQRLLNHLDINPEIANAIADWIDKDSFPEFPGGAEDASYSTLPIAYRTANHFLTDTSEIMAVQGLTKLTARRLLPYLSTLPIGTEINLNTASVPILISMSDEFTTADTELITATRDDTPFEKGLDDLIELVPGIDANNLIIPVTVKSSYFVTEVEVGMGDRIYRQHSFLLRDQTGQTGVYQRVRMPKRLPERAFEENNVNTPQAR